MRRSTFSSWVSTVALRCARRSVERDRRAGVGLSGDLALRLRPVSGWTYARGSRTGRDAAAVVAAAGGWRFLRT